MNNKILIIGTIIKTVFVFIELITLIYVSIVTFSNDGNNVWGYWGTVAAILIPLSPIVVYILANTVFNTFNIIIILRNNHKIKAINTYYILSLIFLIFGIIIGSLYGFVLVVPFLLENIFLFIGYKKEYNKSKEK